MLAPTALLLLWSLWALLGGVRRLRRLPVLLILEPFGELLAEIESEAGDEQVADGKLGELTEQLGNMVKYDKTVLHKNYRNKKRTPSNRIRTSDLWMSAVMLSNYSPPLYQLSYRRIHVEHYARR